MRGAVAFDAAFVGIYSGGAWLAERLATMIPGEHPVGFIDVSFYRDDYARTGLKSGAKRSDLPFDVEGATIVLVDDVLYTGRSVRAAINELFDYGRPARIELAVLVDRGGRELPIEPTYCGARLAVARDLSIVLARDGERLRFGVENAQRALTSMRNPAAQRQRRAHAPAHARRSAAPT